MRRGRHKHNQPAETSANAPAVTTVKKRKWLLPVILVVIPAVTTVVVALIAKDWGQNMSFDELVTLLNDRVQKVDQFLISVSTAPELDDAERKLVVALLNEINARHNSHVDALREHNPIVAHDRQKELLASLAKADELMKDLRHKYPALAGSASIEHREYFDGHLMEKMAYKPKEETVWQKLKKKFTSEHSGVEAR